MVNFELSEKRKKGFFKSWQEHGTKEKKSMFMRNQTSDLLIPHSDAEPLTLSHRDSTVSKAITKYLFF